jgi:hypothetical protein
MMTRTMAASSLVKALRSFLLATCATARRSPRKRRGATRREEGREVAPGTQSASGTKCGSVEGEGMRAMSRDVATAPVMPVA